jgi:putative CocE/NonD family hydrolase
VLVYTTAVLKERIELIGMPVVELFAASDARDTDFTAKIVDVHPDGKALRLGPLPVGVLRARYRNGYGEPQFLTPGKSEKYRIPLWDFAHTFLPGHRLRIEISSSAYPFVAPNPNTGNPIPTDTESKVAHQTVYHDQLRPSHVALPVMPKP